MSNKHIDTLRGALDNLANSLTMERTANEARDKKLAELEKENAQHKENHERNKKEHAQTKKALKELNEKLDAKLDAKLDEMAEDSKKTVLLQTKSLAQGLRKAVRIDEDAVKAALTTALEKALPSRTRSSRSTAGSAQTSTDRPSSKRRRKST
mmetsp:Transcript_38961/g.54347  ORF Transcript_38961/g.54347 Transcript_38961/m.54347 type:complete len:153 (-) Transcript_38961:71-529(-)